MNNKINSTKEFARKIVRYQTYSPRGKPPLEIKGKIEYNGTGREGKKYSFKTDFEIKTSAIDIVEKNYLSLDYISPHDDEHNELAEINLYLKEIENDIQETLKDPTFFIQRNLEGKLIKTKLDEKKGLLVVFPFQ